MHKEQSPDPSTKPVHPANPREIMSSTPEPLLKQVRSIATKILSVPAAIILLYITIVLFMYTYIYLTPGSNACLEALPGLNFFDREDFKSPLTA